MSIESRRVSALAAASLLSLGALTACASPDADPGAADTETDVTAPDDVDEYAAGGPECLIGDWYIAQDQMQAFYGALSDTNEDFNITVEGGTGLAFSDTSYTYTPDFSIILQTSGIDGEGTITGGISGDYVATETEITTSHEESDIAMSIVVSGIAIDGTELTSDFISSAPVNSAPYECGADGPIIHFSTGDDNPTVPMQLTPAS